MLVIAHRSNTLPALERAIELGADYAELDVWYGSVVTHDRPARGEQLPTLREMVDHCAGRVALMVELKRPKADDVGRALDLLDDSAVLVSFNRQALALARSLRPGLRTVQHVGFGASIRGAAAGWAAGFADGRVTASGIAIARTLGLIPLVYTVNDSNRARILEAMGVAGVFTDRPDLLRV